MTIFLLICIHFFN